MFTASGQYSMMYVNTDEARADLSPESSDADVLEAYRSFTANSGRYTVDGDHVTVEAYMAKHPNYMHGFMTEEGNGVTLHWGVEDDILKLTWEDGRSATLRRPSQG